MDIRLLGPVEAWSGTTRVDIGPARQRCVLAVLAEQPGRLISVDDLIDRVWAESAPAKARQTLHSYVSRLRRELGQTGEMRLLNRGGGYLLEVAGDQIDLHRFQSLVTAGRAAARSGDQENAAKLLDEGLRLWRGEPLGGVDGRWVEGVRARLVEERLAAMSDRIDADLLLGRHEQVIGELTDMVRDHPWRERNVGQLMLALYRGERQSDALATYRRVQRQLADEGLRPGARLDQLHVMILRGDPVLASPASAAGFTASTARPAATDPVDHGAEHGARRDLAAELRRQWLRPVLEQAAAGALHADLGLAEQPDAVRDSYRDIPVQRLGPSQAMPSGTRLVDLFDDQFSGRCLVLGEAGAGKTTLLVQLARDLLARAENDPRAPMPVVLLLARWTDRWDSLDAWVVEEMAEHYKLPADWTRSWLAAGRLVLLLDGLDEVPGGRGSLCVQAINAFRRDRRSSLTNLVVTSRTADYADLDVRLDVGGAVVVRPLTPGQVDEQLTRAGAELSALRAAAASDPILADLLTTPLMFEVAVLAYQDADSYPMLTGSDVQRLREHLYDRYVSRMLVRDRGPHSPTPNSRFSPADTHRGVVWLARLLSLRGESVFYLDWFTTAWLPDRHAPWPLPASRLTGHVDWRRAATALTYGLAAGWVTGLAYGLSALLSHGIRSDRALEVGAGYGVVVGAVVALAVTLTILLLGDAAGPGWRQYRRVAVYASVFFLAGGAHHAVKVWHEDGPVAGLATLGKDGLVYGLTGGVSLLMAFGLAVVLTRRNRPPDGHPFRLSWRLLDNALAVAVAIDLAVGGSHAVIYGLVHRHTAGLGYGLGWGLGYGLIVGQSLGLAIGLAFVLVNLDAARPAARWRWSARRLRSALAAAFCYGLIYWLVLVLGLSAAMGPAKGPVFGLLVGLVFWLTFALGYALMPDQNLPPPTPASALTASLRAAALPTVATASFVALLVLVAAELTAADTTDELRLSIVTPTLLAGSLTFWFTGGGAWLNHHVARWAAWRAGLLPRRLPEFLAHAADRVLLRRSGGGYQFLHRTLQDHIAERAPDTGASPCPPGETGPVGEDHR